jgi:cytidine deaminase
MAVNDFNDSVKALFVSNLSRDKRTTEWLTNNSFSDKLDRTRGGDDAQLVLENKQPNGSTTLNVVTLGDLRRTSLDDMKGLDLSVDPLEPKPSAVKPDPGITEYKPQQVNIKTVEYSESAQNAAKELADEKGINVDEMVKNLVLTSQEKANELDKEIVGRKGDFDNAPISHYRYISAAQADNGKIYTAYNTEFYGEFMYDVVCSERIATAKAVNDGANKIYAIAVNNNQNHSDASCAECLGWLSGNRGGANLLIANIVRDKEGNKTDKVLVKTLSELLTDIHAPSKQVVRK